MARDRLDLHGYRADDVEAELDRFLVEISTSKVKRAKILTGKGTGVVKSIVTRYLKLAGYQWSYEKLANGKVNEGCLIIFVD